MLACTHPIEERNHPQLSRQQKPPLLPSKHLHEVCDIRCPGASQVVEPLRLFLAATPNHHTHPTATATKPPHKEPHNCTQWPSANTHTHHTQAVPQAPAPPPPPTKPTKRVNFKRQLDPYVTLPSPQLLPGDKRQSTFSEGNRNIFTEQKPGHQGPRLFLRITKN